MGTISEQALAMAKDLSDVSIDVYKIDEPSWEANIIELSTSITPPYFVFKVAIDNDNPKKGVVKETWFWSEHYSPIPVGYSHLPNWCKGTPVLISLEDGKISKL